MPHYCCMPDCKVKSDKCSYLISWHSIPKVPEKNGEGMKEWRAKILHVIARADKDFNADNAKMCSRHFEDHCFNISKSGRRTLAFGFLPTKFLQEKSIVTPCKPPRKEPPKFNQGRVSKTLHPNSRKAKRKCKLAWRDMKLDEHKGERKKKMQVLGEKLMWFHSNMDTSKSRYIPHDMDVLVEKYFGRFDEELSDIAVSNSIGNRKVRHSARVDSLRFTLQRERREYHTVGIEVPNLLDAKNFEEFRKWNGEMRFYHNIKMMTFYKDGKTARQRTKIAVVKPSKDKGDNAEDGDIVLGNEDMFIGLTSECGDERIMDDDISDEDIVKSDIVEKINSNESIDKSQNCGSKVTDESRDMDTDDATREVIDTNIETRADDGTREVRNTSNRTHTDDSTREVTVGKSVDCEQGEGISDYIDSDDDELIPDDILDSDHE